MIATLLSADLDFDPVPADLGELRAAFGLFPSGVAALCARVDSEPVGMVVTSFSVGVSFEPPLVLFSVQNSSQSWPKLRSSTRIGVSILGEQHQGAALQLSSRNGNRFAGLDLRLSRHGSVFITNSALLLDCEVVSETAAGDHSIIVLQVASVKLGHDTKPLIYHASRFRELAETAA